MKAKSMLYHKFLHYVGLPISFLQTLSTLNLFDDFGYLNATLVSLYLLTCITLLLIVATFVGFFNYKSYSLLTLHLIFVLQTISNIICCFTDTTMIYTTIIYVVIYSLISIYYYKRRHMWFKDINETASVESQQDDEHTKVTSKMLGTVILVTSANRHSDLFEVIKSYNPNSEKNVSDGLLDTTALNYAVFYTLIKNKYQEVVSKQVIKSAENMFLKKFVPDETSHEGIKEILINKREKYLHHIVEYINSDGETPNNSLSALAVEYLQTFSLNDDDLLLYVENKLSSWVTESASLLDEYKLVFDDSLSKEEENLIKSVLAS